MACAALMCLPVYGAPVVGSFRCPGAYLRQLYLPLVFDNPKFRGSQCLFFGDGDNLPKTVSNAKGISALDSIALFRFLGVNRSRHNVDKRVLLLVEVG